MYPLDFRPRYSKGWLGHHLQGELFDYVSAFICILPTYVPCCNSWKSQTNTGSQQWRAQSLLQLMPSTFSIVCVLVVFLWELCLGLVLTRQTWERLLLIWMLPG